ncbi:E3 ubiquitin-protein ligase CHFR isoform X2 [Diabrotica virgifera virgifera]|uniref:E3 ubiquitin-protein ligase CHFR n=1 Tax=Diabrotica virgifera virgifera TaxID=50390 RepID=A0A6P7FZE5_DIAVI|nr:E3 ubiquitin-protein ligase CHFR isoform X2 [Diabrotica virgifera virgifera]
MDTGHPLLVNNSDHASIEINQSPFTLGRGLNCNCLITSPLVSREHCSLEKTANGWCVRDKSTNGTYVNQTSIKGVLSDPLKSGDVIQLSCHHKYTFQNGPNDDSISDEQLCRIADTVLETIEVAADTSLSAPPPEPYPVTLQLDVYPDSSVPRPIRHPVSDTFQPSKRLKTINLIPSTSVSTNVIDLTVDNFIEIENRRDPSTSTNVNGESLETITLDDSSIQVISTTVPSATEMVTVETVCSVEVQSSKINNSQTACTSDTNMGQIESHKPESDSNMMSESQMENELQCAICAEMFVKASTLNCSHTFCKFCIDKWKEKQTICPICRTKITSQVPTLVLDNFIEKIIQGSAQDIQDHRRELLNERAQMQKHQQNLLEQQQQPRSDTRRQGRGRRVQVAFDPEPVVMDGDDSSSSSDTTSTESDSGQEDAEFEDNYWNDDWSLDSEDEDVFSS